MILRYRFLAELWDRRLLVPVLGLVLAVSCSACVGQRPVNLEQISVAALGMPNGLVLVVEPRTCALREDLISALNAASKVPGFEVVGVVVAPVGDPADVEALRVELGATFRIVQAQDNMWERMMRARTIQNPTLLKLHLGRLETIVLGEAAHRSAHPGFRVIPGQVSQ